MNADSNNNATNNLRTEQFIKLLSLNNGRIYAFILSLVSNWSDADNILQETTTTMWRNFDRFEIGTDFAAWAVRIAHYKVLDFRRNQYRQRLQFNNDLIENIEGGAILMSDQLNQRLHALQLCKGKLSQQEQQVIELRYEDDASTKEISQQTGRSVHSLYKDLARIHNKLKFCMNKTLKSQNEGVNDQSNCQPSSNLNPATELKLTEMILELLDGEISDDKFDILTEMLIADQNALHHYVESMVVCASFRLQSPLSANIENNVILQPCNAEGWTEVLEEDLLRAEQLAAQKAAEQAQQLELLAQKRLAFKKAQEHIPEGSKVSLYTTAGAIAAIITLIIILNVWLNPPMPEFPIATLSETIAAQWEGEINYQPGQKLFHRTMKLSQGFAKIQMNDGAVVLIEAPAKFELRGPDEVFLFNGKLTAQINEVARGFVVLTQNMKLIDYGTEFGVEVDDNNNSIVHMTQGSASLIAGLSNQKKDSHMLLANEAIEVDSASSTLIEIPFDGNKFVRHIDSDKNMVWRGNDLCLADIVAGGKGMGNKRGNYGIDPISGKVLAKVNFGERMTQGEYALVNELEMIDGVFVPDASYGPVVINSSGAVFEDCPDTDGQYWTQIVSVDKFTWNMPGTYQQTRKSNIFGDNENPVISMHANLGITFDLQAIRIEFPGIKIKNFKSLCGLSDAPLSGLAGPSKARVWLLVDGKVRLDSGELSMLDDLAELGFELSDTDRFLTVIVTDANDNLYDSKTNNGDWMMLVKPRLEVSYDF
ncbi:MAG: sigma-70 family RNA polymerase sigma factor [Phycisphaerae bacterium]|nr:sigma-70 family RNA polymerase sigma factor [Phycisphaerae bacterium]